MAQGSNLHASRRSEDSENGLDDGQVTTRGRSMSKLKTSGFMEDVDALTPTPKARRVLNGGMSTEANEATSQVSLHGDRDRREEKSSEDNAGNAQDKRNEAFSEAEIDSRILNIGPLGESTCSSRASAGWLSQGKREGWGFGFVDRQKLTELVRTSNHLPEAGVKESATNTWRRALKRVRKEEPSNMSKSRVDKLRPLPSQFDRHGRRRSRANSNVSTEKGRSGIQNASSRRSRSESGKDDFSLKRHQRLCSVARAPLRAVSVSIEETPKLKGRDRSNMVKGNKSRKEEPA